MTTGIGYAGAVFLLIFVAPSGIVQPALYLNGTKGEGFSAKSDNSSALQYMVEQPR